MRLKDKLGDQGNFLFKNRSHLPLLLLPLILLGVFTNHYSSNISFWDFSYNILCILVSTLGFFIRIITIGHVPKNTSGRNRKKQIADKLNTTGIYSVVRNPLYLGNFLMWLGIIMYVRSIYTIIIFILIFFLYYERIIYTEESFLADKFKDEFNNWARKTPSFIPKFRLWQKFDLHFSLRNVLKREYSGFLGALVSFYFIHFLRIFSHTGNFQIEISDLLILGISLSFTIVLRIIRKSTKLLNIKGR